MKTNRTLCIVLLLISLSNIVSAQENAPIHNDAPEARIGLLGGLSIATLVKKTNDESFSSALLYGFNAGGVLLRT